MTLEEYLVGKDWLIPPTEVIIVEIDEDRLLAVTNSNIYGGSCGCCPEHDPENGEVVKVFCAVTNEVLYERG